MLQAIYNETNHQKPKTHTQTNAHTNQKKDEK